MGILRLSKKAHDPTVRPVPAASVPADGRYWVMQGKFSTPGRDCDDLCAVSRVLSCVFGVGRHATASEERTCKVASANIYKSGPEYHIRLPRGRTGTLHEAYNPTILCTLVVR